MNKGSYNSNQSKAPYLRLVKESTSVSCNMCGKPLDTFDTQEDFSIHRKLGYGTKNDGSVLDLHLCCDCLDRLVDNCMISPIIDT